ncbi:MAG: hypothetical protein V4584_07280 [Verrucomicrobiota bacterium]
MRKSSQCLAACAVMLFSSIVWIGVISFVLVHVLGLSHLSGWIIASILGFAATVGISVIFHEMRRATDLTVDFDPAEFGNRRASPSAKRAPKA